MGKPFPQGADPGEEFRDNDLIGLYKPDDTPASIDGSLNKSKTIAELKTMIEDEVINTNTDNIATNSSDITTLEGRATVNENDIDALEVRATTNEGDIDTLEGKVGQSLNTTDAVTFASVNTNNVAIKHKLFTGTLGSTGLYSVAHGLSLAEVAKVVDISFMFLDSGGDWYNAFSTIRSSGDPKESVRISSTTLTLNNNRTSSNSTPFRCIVTYEA